jgi:hypothetical protein
LSVLICAWIQLEFMALSDATGDPSYGERSESVIRMLMEARTHRSAAVFMRLR